MKTCFVSAPQGTALGTLQDSLLAHGLEPLIPEQLSAGTDLASEIQRQMQLADLVVAVLPTAQQSNWVLFELGQASALGKRILVIAPPDSMSLPAAMHRMLVLQTAADNRQAIDFALDQVLSAPAQPGVASERKVFVSFGLGAESDLFLSRIEESLRDAKPVEFERVMYEAIKQSGTDVVVESPQPDRGADFVVWSDVLDAFVGNPLPIEAKLTVQSPAIAKRSLQQLSSYMQASNSRWAVLLYGDGPRPDDPFWADCPPNVLLLPARSLIEALRTRAFPEVIRDLRNRRVHGVRP
jgi:hypothetical protein